MRSPSRLLLPWFPLPVDMTPIEPGHKWHCMESPREKVKKLVTFEELWASGQSFLMRPGPSFAPQPPLMIPPVDVQAPVLLAVLIMVSVTSVATSSAHSVCHLVRPLPLPSCCLVAHLSLTWFLCNPCRSRPRLPVVPGLVPGPVARPAQ